MTGREHPTTSARLREVQADLAASQADLTRALQERDAIGVKLVQALREHNEALVEVQAEMDERRAERDAARLALKTVGEQRDLARAELASAQQENEQLRAAQQWIVARDGGRGCERCEQEVRRGEAYELQPGTGGLIQHVHCPDLPLPDNQNGATGV